jgi:hypothetical protein
VYLVLGDVDRALEEYRTLKGIDRELADRLFGSIQKESSKRNIQEALPVKAVA